jgi:hypothetical protein
MTRIRKDMNWERMKKDQTTGGWESTYQTGREGKGSDGKRLGKIRNDEDGKGHELGED